MHNCRILTIFAFLLLLTFAVSAQNRPANSRETEEFQRLFDSAKAQVYWGRDYKASVVLGDRTARQLISLLGYDGLIKEENALASLHLLSISFDDPGKIRDQVDRSPSQTMKILEYMEKVISNPNIVKKVRICKTFIKKQTDTLSKADLNDDDES